MTPIPLEQRHRVLCDITRAQHFAWREAVRLECPDADVRRVVERMWALTGEQTARAYARRIDADQPLPLQVARSIAWSSQCMGEDALVEEQGAVAFVRHHACPWKDWHERNGLLGECRPGCDSWFGATVEEVNAALGTELRVETLETMPEGAPSCLRRLSVGEPE